MSCHGRCRSRFLNRFAVRFIDRQFFQRRRFGNRLDSTVLFPRDRMGCVLHSTVLLHPVKRKLLRIIDAVLFRRQHAVCVAFVPGVDLLSAFTVLVALFPVFPRRHHRQTVVAPFGCGAVTVAKAARKVAAMVDVAVTVVSAKPRSMRPALIHQALLGLVAVIQHGIAPGQADSGARSE